MALVMQMLKPVAWVIVPAVVVWSIAWHPLGWLFALGLHPYPAGTPWTYQLESGFLPSLTVMTVLTAIITAIRTSNCHVHRCWRIGRYPVAGGQYKVCRHHHPDATVRQGKVTVAHVHKEHHAHLFRAQK